MLESVDIAVVGATGAVGEAMISILEEREFPVGEFFPLASEKSAGKTVMFRGKSHRVGDLSEFDFSRVKVGLFSAGASVSKKYAPVAASLGCIVIDNTSHFRLEKDIPLIIPEVNSNALIDYQQRNIIANPNCSTIQMLVALNPIYDAVGIERINVATYQAVSGTGKKAIEELAGQTASLLNGQEIEAKVYPAQIAFNVLPHIDDFQENGYTREEMKMVWETKKIFDESIQINPTCVRVPVFFGHSEAIHVETRDKISVSEVQDLMVEAKAIQLIDDRKPGGYPTPVEHSAGEDAVFVGRIREDMSHPRGINLWVVSDNVRKGAALNTIQIAESLISSYL